MYMYMALAGRNSISQPNTHVWLFLVFYFFMHLLSVWLNSTYLCMKMSALPSKGDVKGCADES